MERVLVTEVGEGIEEAIRRGLSAGSRTGEGRPALLVVSPKAAKLTRPPTGEWKTVLLPGDAGAWSRNLWAASAVSYGLSPRDTLTVSSREGERLWVAIQRDLVTAEGLVVERQEFPVVLPRGADAMTALAVAGALLLLGVPPERLGQRDLI